MEGESVHQYAAARAYPGTDHGDAYRDDDADAKDDQYGGGEEVKKRMARGF